MALSAPATLQLPLAQRSHEVLPLREEYVPAGQVAHDVAPGAAVNSPGAHASQIMVA